MVGMPLQQKGQGINYRFQKLTLTNSTTHHKLQDQLLQMFAYPQQISYIILFPINTNKTSKLNALYKQSCIIALYHFKALRQPMFDLSQANRLIQLSPNHQPLANPLLIDNPLAQDHYQPTFNSTNVQTQDKNDGKWSLREVMKYYLFLIQFKHLFKTQQMRKSQKVFSLMAKHIQTRKTSQCKSHHQKILKNLGSIEEIIKQYKSILSPLNKEWQYFYKTQKQVLIKEYPQQNDGQHYYRILKFKKCIRIYIEEECIESYQP